MMRLKAEDIFTVIKLKSITKQINTGEHMVFKNSKYIFSFLITSLFISNFLSAMEEEQYKGFWE
jgi:hypothetical protein